MKISLVSTGDKLTDITSTTSAFLMFVTVVGKFHLKVIKNTFPTQAFYSEFYHYLQATDQSIP